MPENERSDSTDPETAWDSAQSADARGESQPDQAIFANAARARIGKHLQDSTSHLLKMLQLRLEHLRAIGDERASEISGECEKVLAEIREQIDALIQEDGTSNFGDDS